MKRSELEKYIGESVEVKLFDGDTMQGVLRKTGTEEVRNNPNLYLKRGYYFYLIRILMYVNPVYSGYPISRA